MSARAAYYIKLAVSASASCCSGALALRFALEPGDRLCEAPSMTKPLRFRRIDRRALTDRGADLSDRRVVQNAIHLSNYHPGE